MSILRPASPEPTPTHAKRVVQDFKLLPKVHYCPKPSQLWNGGEVMEIVSKPLIDRKRDAMFQSLREFDEDGNTTVKMSRNSRIPEARVPVLEQAAKHQSAVPEIHVPDDDLDGPYNFQVVPPSPNKPEVSVFDRQDPPEEEEEPSPDVEGNEAPKYPGASHPNAKLRVVETGTGREVRCDPPPYSALEYGRRVKNLGFGN